jgi:hypothetical protein
MSSFDDYSTLLTGAGDCSYEKKLTALKVARRVKKAKKAKECAYGGKMTYEDRLKNLEKARAVRASNLAKKKSMKGKGNYTQDYVDESQINYAGSPLDMYYLGTEKQERKQKQKRGEIGGGKLSKTDELKIDEILGGKMTTKRKMKVKEIEDDIDGGAMKYDIPEAVRVLAELASKFGLKLVK